ncbi:nicotinate phosphoribosyltransferase [Sodiomyces alkalinus F11]|uniref:Nicotinate phosphoribosyltransferase n=1 Tax=Sodiomyces alkalinus (strain CBS 110278 / VKM F-3762 / F11) TaxID=1314773 RepID=A0A3N2PZT3_SODAK|nr:nicotinate phosphoribosyltransferase [Sodiomyces alkalinus F11]ROT39936.1 nicotinate phosphoribosyltransferase [Sodiomyces alkalinus F11]
MAAMDFNSSSPYPEGVISFLDTDLYKLTMQCAVMKYFKDVPVTYAFTNRTPEKKLSRAAFRWLEEQVQKLGNISLTDEECTYLRSHCPYLTSDYLAFLKEFRLDPREQVVITFTPSDSDTGADSDEGDIHIEVKGTWSQTILYEIPMLALASEAYFRFMDTDWSYEGQEERAFEKGLKLLEAGCTFSEFGTRRRRDYHTQALVFRGLSKASKEAEARGLPGKLTGTSNVHLAMRFGIPPVGTVAHEWFMGIAAITNDYRNATETALRYWVDAFGGQLGIALTDTFGTEEFLRAFSQPVKPITGDDSKHKAAGGRTETYAELFAGIRQDSGDPAEYVQMLRQYYDEQGIKEKKTMVFSDSLNIERCLEYKKISEDAGFAPTFGVGTFLTNDFVRLKDGSKSVPLNIVIKLSSAAGRPAVKISDNIGKNTGDKQTVQKVKQELGYVEREWKGGDETARWGKDESK